MALLVSQLLFACDSGPNMQLDLVVLGRATLPESPPVGMPLSFEFALPGDAAYRAAMARVLQRWADEMAVVELDVLERDGRTRVRVATAATAVILGEPVR